MGRQPVSSRPYGYDGAVTPAGGSWPGGARLAVYVAVGVEEYRPGGRHSEDLLPGVPAPDHVNQAWRDYGNRVGVFRLLDHLDALAIPPTLLWNSLVYDTAPAVALAARRHGAELVAHGLSNSDSLTDLTDAEEEGRYLRSVADRIDAEEGTPPLGWSSPWLSHTPHTLDLLPAAGYRYLLDLRADDRPVWLQSQGGPLLGIPYALELNDSTTMIGRCVSAADFADMIVDEFDELLEASQEQPLVLSVVLHSFVSGAPFRLRRVVQALRHLASRPEQVWLTQPRRIYRHVTAERDGAAATAPLLAATIAAPFQEVLEDGV